MKKLVSLVLLIGMVLTSLYVSTPEMGEVQAAAVTTDTDGNYIKEYTDVKTYRKAETVDGSGEVKYVFTAPTLTVDAGDDYADFVFAGWFTDNTCETPLGKTDVTTETAYAKFVPRDTLSVKFQTANATVTDTEHTVDTNVGAIRFISSVDSLDYSKIGFELEENVQSEEKITGSYEASDVFQRIDSTMQINGVEKEYNFSPKVIGTKSEHFFTAKWPVTEATKSTDFKVQAYWITLDGTKVLGDARVVGLDDGSSSKNILNLSVDNVLTTENDETYTARLTTYATAAGETFEETFPVEVLYQGTDYTNIRINMDSVDLDGVEGADVTLNDLTSATKVTIVEETDITGVYRRYDTSHESDKKHLGFATDCYAGKPDVSWYYIDTNVENFVIASSADMYGLAYLSDYVAWFKNTTITLVRDVELNEGTAVKAKISADKKTVETPASWQPGEDGKIYHWDTIGHSGNYFAGTFDGDGNIISGLYQKITTNSKITSPFNNTLTTGTNYGGLFDCTKEYAVIKNLSLKNSYIEKTASFVGSIASVCNQSTFENVYSDAVMVTSNSDCGGLVGRMTGVSTILNEFNNCWYDGQINITGSGNDYGGFVAQIYKFSDNGSAGLTMKNCLNSGEIIHNSSATNLNTGGFIGAANQKIAFFKMTNGIDVGNVYLLQSGTTYAGACVGNGNGGTEGGSPVHSYSLGNLYSQGNKTDVMVGGGSYVYTRIALKTEAEIKQIVETDLQDSYVVQKDGKIALKYFAQ